MITLLVTNSGVAPRRFVLSGLVVVLVLCGAFATNVASAAEEAAPVATAGSWLSTAGWLVGYGGVIVAASLFGGWIPGRVVVTHARLQHVISFVAGLMLGIALLHLLPHALTAGTRVGSDVISGFVLLGILAMFLLLRAFHFHVHEPETLVTETEDGPSPLVIAHECSAPGHSHVGHSHDHDHDHDKSGHAIDARRMGWMGVFVGLAIHTLVDGLALGAAMTADLAAHAGVPFPGLGILAAVALHKPLDSMSITSIMDADGWSKKSQLLANVGVALLCPLGATLFFLGTSVGNNSFIACSLAFSAGVFLCVALADLLPEMEFHTHDRMTLSLALAAGIVVAWLIRLAEPGHLHG